MNNADTVAVGNPQSLSAPTRTQPPFCVAVRADVWRLYGRFSWALAARAWFTKPFFRPLFTHRLYHGLAAWPGIFGAPLRLLVRLAHRSLTARRCMQLPIECVIGPGLLMKHSYGFIVNGGAMIGSNVTVLHQVTLGGSRKGAPDIGAFATLAAGALVIGPVRLGEGCTVGAGALVVKDVAPLAVVAGNPATVIGTDTAPRTVHPAPMS